MKISDTFFFETTHLFYQPLPFYGINQKILRTQTPLFTKGRGSTMYIY